MKYERNTDEYNQKPVPAPRARPVPAQRKLLEQSVKKYKKLNLDD